MVSKVAGLAQVAASGAQTYSRRDEAKLAKAEGQAKLDKLQHDKTTGATNTEMDALTAQNKELLRQNQQQATYRALDAYTADYDPRHLNQLIKHPMMKGKFPDLISLDKIDTTNDTGIMQRQGFTPDMFNDPATKENAAGRYLKATMKDGSKKMIDMLTIYAGTGYTRYLDNLKLQSLLTKNKIAKASGKDDKPPSMVQKANAVAEAKKRIAKAEKEGKEPSINDKEIVEFGTAEKAGVRPGQLTQAEERTASLVNKFGGETKFFETDFSDPDNYRKAYSDIAAIERLENVQYTPKEKTDLANIRMLIAMGDPARNLSEDETGVFDSTFLKAKKYMSDEVGGVEATSAYAAFRNTVRNALFGSALTEAEITAFHDAFGGLGQKLGPVLQQFKTALTQTQAKLQSIARMKNPYSAYVRLGIDEERMDRILASLDDRIAALDEFGSGLNPDVKKKVGEMPGFGGKK